MTPRVMLGPAEAGTLLASPPAFRLAFARAVRELHPLLPALMVELRAASRSDRVPCAARALRAHAADRRERDGICGSPLLNVSPDKLCVAFGTPMTPEGRRQAAGALAVLQAQHN